MEAVLPLTRRKRRRRRPPNGMEKFAIGIVALSAPLLGENLAELVGATADVWDGMAAAACAYNVKYWWPVVYGYFATWRD